MTTRTTPSRRPPPSSSPSPASRRSTARARSCASRTAQSLHEDIAVGPHRLARPRHRARHRRLPARPHRRDLRPGVERQDDAHAPRHRAACRRPGGVAAFIDAEHALDATYARKLGVKTDELLVSPARLRRAGARDRRHARALERGRHHRRRLGRGARAQGRDRGRHGRQPRRPAGAPHEPGAPQAHRHGRALATACSSSSTRSA